MAITKPRKRVKTYYDFTECVEYIEHKYGLEHRPINGKKGDDLWHYILDTQGDELGRGGGDIVISRDEFPRPESENVKKFLDLLVEEFAEKDEKAVVFHLSPW